MILQILAFNYDFASCCILVLSHNFAYLSSILVLTLTTQFHLFQQPSARSLSGHFLSILNCSPTNYSVTIVFCFFFKPFNLTLHSES